jgi:hypothetical protein
MKIPFLKTVQGAIMVKILEGCLRWQVIAEMAEKMPGRERHKNSS